MKNQCSSLPPFAYPHKRPARRRGWPCHDVIMWLQQIMLLKYAYGKHGIVDLRYVYLRHNLSGGLSIPFACGGKQGAIWVSVNGNCITGYRARSLKRRNIWLIIVVWLLWSEVVLWRPGIYNWQFLSGIHVWSIGIAHGTHLEPYMWYIRYIK